MTLPIKEYEKVWIFNALPFRPVWNSNYGYSSFETLPSIEVWKEFENIKTLQDVKVSVEIIEKNIVASCFVQVDEKEKSFYCDQYGRVIWYFDPEIGVYIDDVKVVAPDIPTFFSRVRIESGISQKYINGFYSVTNRFKSCPTKNEWDINFEKAQKIMDKHTLGYVTNYYKAGPPRNNFVMNL